MRFTPDSYTTLAINVCSRVVFSRLGADAHHIEIFDAARIASKSPSPWKNEDRLSRNLPSSKGQWLEEVIQGIGALDWLERLAMWNIFKYGRVWTATGFENVQCPWIVSTYPFLLTWGVATLYFWSSILRYSWNNSRTPSLAGLCRFPLDWYRVWLCTMGKGILLTNF